ncbi:unnamed protein product [Eruca vesicaria subsp. sativa]|uniref:Protein kinase domain-containing protein n=1 Tax=Eruca vesicaria subsp. sativa TaxID=29727 RepID=A0ABC8KZL2_ERUVS|nr:unnamed protein product [Eruca vesicaria subsp. sativa]
MSYPELHFEQFLGEGSYGSVSLYTYKATRNGKTLYAAAKTSDEKHADSLYREFQILSELKGCPRIVQCYGTKVQERLNEKRCLEYKFHMEYAPGGSLRSFVNHFKDNKLPDALIRDFTRMLLEGLAIIHGHGYVHCDLKPANILVFPSCVYKNGAWRSSHELKISDFGLSRRDGDTSWWQPHRLYAGTPIYMSPESISHGETGKGLDLWSLGCVVLEMYTGKRPWWHKEYKLEDLKNCHAPLIPREIPFEAKLFLMTCFSPEVDDRKDASTLLNHIFLRGDVSKITESPMTGDNSRKISLELEKLRERLSGMRSICV